MSSAEKKVRPESGLARAQSIILSTSNGSYVNCQDIAEKYQIPIRQVRLACTYLRQDERFITQSQYTEENATVAIRVIVDRHRPGYLTDQVLNPSAWPIPKSNIAEK